MTQQPYGPPDQYPGPGGAPYPGGQGGYLYPGQAQGGYPYPGQGGPVQGGYPYAYPGPGQGQYGQPYPGAYGPPPRRGVPVWVWISGAAVLVIGLVVALVVLTGGGPKATSPTAGPLAAPAAAPRPSESSRPGAAGGGASSGGTAAAPAAFGERVTTESGLTIEVSAPEVYRPGPSAVGNDRERAVRIRTTVTNDSAEPYSLNGIVIGPEPTHAGEVVGDIWDLSENPEPFPLETVAPGSSFTYETSLSIGAQPGELELVYSPDLIDGGPDVVYAGEI